MIAQIITGLSAGAAYALVAVGVVLIYKCTRVLSLAQGEIGAFGFFIGLRWAARGVPGLGWHPPRFVTLLVAVLVGALLGALIERIVLRPLVGRPPLDALIATLGVALFLALLEKEMFGTATQFAPSPVGEWKVVLLGATLTAPRVDRACARRGRRAGDLLLLLAHTLRARGACHDRRPDGRPADGHSRRRACTASRGSRPGVLSGLAAALLGPAFGGLTPFAMTQFSLRALAGAVIGGLDSIVGAIVGSLLVGVLEAVVGGHFRAPGTAEFAVLVLVIATLVTRPQGLLGAEGAG